MSLGYFLITFPFSPSVLVPSLDLSLADTNPLRHLLPPSLGEVPPLSKGSLQLLCLFRGKAEAILARLSVAKLGTVGRTRHFNCTSRAKY